MKSRIASAIESNTLSLPSARHLLGRANEVPLVIIGDKVFSLKALLMKPYPSKVLTDYERNYNYRHFAEPAEVQKMQLAFLLTDFVFLPSTYILNPRSAPS